MVSNACNEDEPVLKARHGAEVALRERNQGLTDPSSSREITSRTMIISADILDNRIQQLINPIPAISTKYYITPLQPLPMLKIIDPAVKPKQLPNQIYKIHKGCSRYNAQIEYFVSPISQLQSIGSFRFLCLPTTIPHNYVG